MNTVTTPPEGRGGYLYLRFRIFPTNLTENKRFGLSSVGSVADPSIADPCREIKTARELNIAKDQGSNSCEWLRAAAKPYTAVLQQQLLPWAQ